MGPVSGTVSSATARETLQAVGRRIGLLIMFHDFTIPLLREYFLRIAVCLLQWTRLFVCQSGIFPIRRYEKIRQDLFYICDVQSECSEYLNIIYYSTRRIFRTNNYFVQCVYVYIFELDYCKQQNSTSFSIFLFLFFLYFCIIVMDAIRMIEKVREKVPLNVSLRTFPLSLSKYIYIYICEKSAQIFLQ